MNTRRKFSLFAFAVAVSTAAIGAPTTASTQSQGEWESAIAKFETMDRSSPPAPGSIVFYGSSSIRKWDLQKFFPGLPVINRGFGGSQMADAATYEHRVIPECHPKTVVLYSGDNDVAAKKSPTQIVQQFEQFADQMHHDVPDAKLIVISIKPSILRWSMFDTMKQVNSGIRTAIESRPWAAYLDIDPLMLDDKGQPLPALFQNDHLHMTDIGYERWSDALRPLLIQN